MILSVCHWGCNVIVNFVVLLDRGDLLSSRTYDNFRREVFRVESVVFFVNCQRLFSDFALVFGSKKV